MSVVPNRHITATIFKHLQDNLAQDVDQGSPGIFDPTDTGVSEWFHVEIGAVRGMPTVSGTAEAFVTIKVTAASKSQTEMYKAESLLDSVSALLSAGSVLSVKDYTTSDPTVVGYLRIIEPRVRPSARKVWQEQIMEIDAKFYEVT